MGAVPPGRPSRAPVVVGNQQIVNRIVMRVPNLDSRSEYSPFVTANPAVSLTFEQFGTILR